MVPYELYSTIWNLGVSAMKRNYNGKPVAVQSDPACLGALALKINPQTALPSKVAAMPLAVDSSETCGFIANIFDVEQKQTSGTSLWRHRIRSTVYSCDIVDVRTIFSSYDQIVANATVWFTYSVRESTPTSPHCVGHAIL